MASIDVSSREHGRRALDRPLPLIPFIDFLLCLISFLMITAVWSQMARLDASAAAPGKQGPPDPQPDKILHVELKPTRDFTLVWKQGGTVISSLEVPRDAVDLGDGVDYPKLRTAVVEQWNSHGSHRAASDPKLDQAVLHASNSAEFREIAAVIDALHGAQRDYDRGAGARKVHAFNVTFAVD